MYDWNHNNKNDPQDMFLDYEIFNDEDENDFKPKKKPPKKDHSFSDFIIGAVFLLLIFCLINYIFSPKRSYNSHHTYTTTKRTYSTTTSTTTHSDKNDKVPTMTTGKNPVYYDNDRDDRDYDDPEDFYYDNYDEFDDYEDAEDYYYDNIET